MLCHYLDCRSSKFIIQGYVKSELISAIKKICGQHSQVHSSLTTFLTCLCGLVVSALDLQAKGHVDLEEGE